MEVGSCNRKLNWRTDVGRNLGKKLGELKVRHVTEKINEKERGRENGEVGEQ